ncbi:hypothetical protein R2601_20876 [Salipiger bermudensis HTCC2601]|uniref:Uncharacterized protein n=1 Tax=Salipiger bermudensis (strain DSM 26914 / JCM 13377 / KCTC 12554 / HTCC2601) TaxID=314265 RepID=Q0FT64_SALBH|nr:hypothetical protein R2601_20876 [Salipiger bermudensis HTCC2601]
MSVNEQRADRDAFFSFERVGDDLPYYRGGSDGLSPAGWLVVI